MLHLKLITGLWGVACLLCAFPLEGVTADGKAQGRYGGKLSVGLIYLQSRDNLAASDGWSGLGDEQTPSLSAKPEPKEMVAPYVSGSVHRKLVDDGQLFLRFGRSGSGSGSRAPGLAGGIESLPLGLAKGSATVFGTPKVADTVWKARFLTTEDHDATGQAVYGGSLSLKMKLVLPVSFRYQFVRQEVETEQSGESIPGLSEANRDALARTGSSHRLALKVTLPFSKT